MCVCVCVCVWLVCWMSILGSIASPDNVSKENMSPFTFIWSLPLKDNTHSQDVTHTPSQFPLFLRTCSVWNSWRTQGCDTVHTQLPYTRTIRSADISKCQGYNCNTLKDVTLCTFQLSLPKYLFYKWFQCLWRRECSHMNVIVLHVSTHLGILLFMACCL